MRESETLHLITHIIGEKKKTNFVRKGKHEKGASKLSKNDIEYILNVAGQTMNILNYLDVKDKK